MRNGLGTNYWRLWTASVVSNLGDGISGVAYPWLASVVTRNPVNIALIGVATRLPWLIFTLPAGVITDRVDRRRLVVWMDVLRTVVTVGVAVTVLTVQSDLASPEAIATGSARPPVQAGFLLAVLYVSATLFGMAEVLRDNAAQTLMPSMVAREHLEKANGRLWGAEMVMNSFIGPPAGGLLLAVAFSLPFFIDAGTFAVAAAMVALLAGSFRPRPAEGVPERRSFGGDLKDGFRWLWNHRLLRSLAIILGLLNAAASAATATLVLFAQEILGLDATGFGLLASAGAVGGVAGSFLAARVSKAIGSGRSLALSLGTLTVTWAVIGVTSSAPLVWAMFALSAFTAVLWNVITVSLRQAIIPDHFLGRVNSVYRFFGWGMMPIGIFLGGWLVAGVSAITERSAGLRSPYLAAALIHLLILVYAVPRLTTARLEAARAEAEPR
ncbi:MAG TPA: MFS transporter [Acidimicrobiia bacterium]|nr:MFS transporter [Acidimicrobiia bacterium]